MAFGNIKNTTAAEKKLEMMNNSEEPVNIEFERVPAHITIKVVPASLKPGEKGLLVATYDTPSAQRLGICD